MTCSMLRSAIAVAALCLAAPASAATFCATNALELSTALNDAAGNGEDDVVRVQTGTYDGGGVHDFDYAPAEFETGGDVGTSLTVIGGYSPFFDNPCGQILVEDPLLTILDGGDVRRALKLHVLEDSDITVRLLTFMNGTPGDDPFFFGGGLSYRALGGAAGKITIERNAFIANEAHSGGGLAVYQATAMVRVINNLFLANNADACAAAHIRKLNGPSLLDAAYITNNTAIGNSTPNTIGGGGGICAHVEETDMYIYNNNVWDNDLNDLYLGGTGGFNLRNNNFNVRDGVGPTVDEGNIGVEPVYEGGWFNFTPVRTSPLVDAGLFGPPATIGIWYLTELDLRAQARVVGTAVDIGAYENERIFANGFETPGPFDASRIETLCERLGCDAAAR